MLTNEWEISLVKKKRSLILWSFDKKDERGTYIFLEAKTELEAWGKLAKMMGKDKEIVEVIEGVVTSYDYWDQNFPGIDTGNGGYPLENILEYEGKRVKITVELVKE